MLEVLVVVTFFGYIFYLRNYADLRSKSEKEEAEFAAGIALYKQGHFDESQEYFQKRVAEKPKSSFAYLYRGLSLKGKGNRVEALQDMRTAVSLDDEVYQASLELGKFYLENEDFEAALAALESAVTKAQQTSPEPYFWRAQAYLALNRQVEAEQDLATQKHLETLSTESPGQLQHKGPFVDKKLIASTIMVLFTSALIVTVVKDAESIHLPYLVAVVCAIAIGFAEPHKGWLLALLQCILVLGGYFLFTTLPETSSGKELENFSLYGAVILTFVASFLGGFMKRAFN